MPSLPVVDRIGHLAIRTTDVDAAALEAVRTMGMREVERVDGCAYLTLGAEHHSLQYLPGDRDELDHLGLVAAGPEALERVRARAQAAGWELLSPEPLDAGIAAGLAIRGPEGVVYEVYLGMAEDQPAYAPTGVRPSRLGHVTLHPREPEPVRAFLEDVLDFRLSDTITGEGHFLRCNAEHHGIGMFRGRGTLHHSGWKVRSIAELGRLGDLLHEQGRNLLWGPVRHGAGHNIAAYFPEPAGSVIEYYTDMESIWAGPDWVPRTWDGSDPSWYTQWAPGRPQGFRDFGLPPAVRRA